MREVARLAVTEGENISDRLRSPSLASIDTQDKKIKEKEKTRASQAQLLRYSCFSSRDELLLIIFLSVFSFLLL